MIFWWALFAIPAGIVGLLIWAKYFAPDESNDPTMTGE